ncbi:MAG: ATP-binding protein [Polyangiaceae bacterium]|nr:ATP-binding protein [Polyangiaceae bacterium]
MLKYLHLKNIGPAAEMRMDLAPRLNLITGDNGLGKSFLLDVAWWALTRTWPRDINDGLSSGYKAQPTRGAGNATIEFEIERAIGESEYKSEWGRHEQNWIGDIARPLHQGTVIYALPDGGFAVWDPARNYWDPTTGGYATDTIPAFVFREKDVWDGLVCNVEGKSVRVCNGLIDDWQSWIRDKSSVVKVLRTMLADLSTTRGDDQLGLSDKLIKISRNDARRMPMVTTGQGRDVPIVYASRGIRRIAALAYMLLWSFMEHVSASELIDIEPLRHTTLLFDEIEAHLHPRWQRSIVRSVLGVAEQMTDTVQASVQLIAATHSPLVLASVESMFRHEKDAWFDIDANKTEVELRKCHYVPRGEIGNWLRSQAFDLGEPRSIEGEEAVCAAVDVLNAENPELVAIESADRRLRRAGLPDIDRFWVRWNYFLERAREAAGGGKP